MNAQNAQWFILVLVNIPVYLALGRIIFKDWDSFLENIRLWSSMDWILTLEKQWREERWETSKLPVFLFACIALVVAEYLMFGRTIVRPSVPVIATLQWTIPSFAA